MAERADERREDAAAEDGAPVVFAHALGTDLRVWDRVVALLPPIGLVGVVALAFLLLLLYVHQGYVSPVARARYQRPLWALLALLMIVALLLGWGFRVPCALCQ